MAFGSRKRQVVRFASIQSIGYVLATLIGFPLQYAMASVLGPTGIGGLRVINLVKKYATYANLGIIKGYRKQYVEALAENDADAAHEIDRVGFTGLIVSTALSVLIVIIIYIFGIDVGGTFTATAMVLVCLTLITERLYSYLTVRTQSQDAFDAVGGAIFIARIITPILTIVGLLAFGFNGVLLALMLAPLTGAYFLYRSQRHLSPGLHFHWRQLRRMFTEGGWQYLDGLFTNLILTMGLALSVFYLSDTEIGVYAFADGIFTASLTLPASLQMIYFNNMVNIRKNSLGEAAAKKEFRRLLRTPLTMFIAFTLVIMAAKYLVYVFLIQVALPEFEPSLPIMAILLFGQSLYITQTIATQYFVATDQVRLSATLSGTWAIITYFILSRLMSITPGPTTLALGSTMTLLGYTAVFLFVMFYQTSGKWTGIWQQFRYWVACFVVCATLIVLTAVSQITPDPTILEHVAWLVLEGGVMLVVLITAFSLIFADQNIAREIRSTSGYLLQLAWRRLPFTGSASADTPDDTTTSAVQ